MTSTSQERHTQFEKEVKKNGNSNNHSEKGNDRRVDGEQEGSRRWRTGSRNHDKRSQNHVAFDIEEVREIKNGMDEDAKTYYDDMVKKGTELLAEMKALATTVELEDDATQIKYRMGISNGTLYFEEITKEASE